MRIGAEGEACAENARARLPMQMTTIGTECPTDLQRDLVTSLFQGISVIADRCRCNPMICRSRVTIAVLRLHNDLLSARFRGQLCFRKYVENISMVSENPRVLPEQQNAVFITNKFICCVSLSENVSCQRRKSWIPKLSNSQIPNEFIRI